jgi:serine phosphatase RsbU (regulator of sigma subunit)
MVTAICGYIEPRSLRIDYATAGHPAPILAFPDKEPYFLEHDGLPLGILPGVRYQSFSTQAAAGALLVLYTDGVIEHKRDLVEGERRLLDAARSVASQPTDDPAAGVRRAIFADKAPDDDVAIMTVSFAVLNRGGCATINAYSPAGFTVAGSGADAPEAPQPLL